MKKLTSYCLLFALASTSAVYATEPTNLGLLKKELVQYYDSGKYDQDVSQTVTEAMQYLKARIAEKSFDNKKPAIVLDIDETSLSNYPNMAEMGFGGNKKQISQAEMKANDPAIKSTLALYQYAKANQVAVFFITGRHEEARTATVKNLKAAGYTDWNGLTFRSGPYLKATVSDYKSAIRKQITEQGYDIVLNMGDQQSDLNGGYADKSYKLSNPYYFIP